MFDAETITFATAIAGAVVSSGAFMWKKLVQPAIKFLEDQEDLKKSIQTIKSEVTPNGGGSMKDALNSLRQTCGNIERNQKVLDQRSKAALHYHDRALFEIDSSGRLSWFNDQFEVITKGSDSPKKGFDWVNIVDECGRDDFVKEIASCLEMNRKIDIVTKSVAEHNVHFLGYPYRITENEHEGFLIHLYKEN